MRDGREMNSETAIREPTRPCASRRKTTSRLFPSQIGTPIRNHRRERTPRISATLQIVFQLRVVIGTPRSFSIFPRYPIAFIWR